MRQIIQNAAMKTKCDVKDCKNDADFYVLGKGKIHKFFVCRECLQALADNFSQRRTPKSPKNTIKKIMDSRTEEIE